MRPTLRFVTCGSVDDGKSTLVGRMLLDSHQVFDDQWRALASDSLRYGTQGSTPDLALLLDGLEAEREQGITIDVAYRYFATPERRFIVADAPGHVEFTRNMVSGASTADVALLLVDARKGLVAQTLRHSRIVALLGVRNVVLAVNKMDLVAWDRTVFDTIVAGFAGFAKGMAFDSVVAIPISALGGGNIVRPEKAAAWYAGPTLLAHLEGIETSATAVTGSFRFPVQWVNRPHQDFRGLCGRVAGGVMRRGDRVRSVPGDKEETTIASIVVEGGEVDIAAPGDCVTLLLADDLDVGRGAVIAPACDPVECADQFEACVVWMSGVPLLAGRSYLLKIHCMLVGASITAIKHVVDIDSGAHLAAHEVAINEIAVVNLSTDRPVPYEPYARGRRLGAFILIDRLSYDTVGGGMIAFALRRAANLHWQPLTISKPDRAALKGLRFLGLESSVQRPAAHRR